LVRPDHRARLRVHLQEGAAAGAVDVQRLGHGSIVAYNPDLTGRSNSEEGRLDRIRIHLKVNGEERECLAPVHHTLLEVLREELGLPGTTHGRELGECGPCTVLLDGRPILSCVALPVECEGREVTTVEGLAGEALHPLQEAFAELGAAQCGYCT